MEQNFFGLPDVSDPEFNSVCAVRIVNLLKELRYVASEVGITEARRMPTEIRHWWIEQMQKENQPKESELLTGKKGNSRIRTRDV